MIANSKLLNSANAVKAADPTAKPLATAAVVFPVHGVGGIIGIIMVSFLGVQGGFLGSSAGESWIPMEQLYIQLKGILVIGLWTAIASWAILKLIGSFTTLRVTEEEEYQGLDVVEHEERGYDLT